MQLEELRRTKVVISCAMTGTSPPRAKNPHLPVTPEEIAEENLRILDELKRSLQT